MSEEKNDGPVLITFGPRGPVPKNHRHCNACDGSGESSCGDGEKCEVCAGKGYHSQEDIDRYHRKYPAVCQSSCGSKHARRFSDREWRELDAKAGIDPDAIAKADARWSDEQKARDGKK
jgi:hypothetical protein